MDMLEETAQQKRVLLVPPHPIQQMFSRGFQLPGGGAAGLRVCQALWGTLSSQPHSWLHHRLAVQGLAPGTPEPIYSSQT